MNIEKKETCLFSEIEQGKLFIYEGNTLGRFGKYGMGIGINGTIAEVFNDNTIVEKVK